MTGEVTTPPVVDWLDPETLLDDPYPSYARLRAESPVAWLPFMSTFLASTYETCRAVLMHPETFSQALDTPGAATMRRVVGRSTMLDVDDPQHATERTPVNPGLRPKAMKEHWASMFTANARCYLDAVAESGPDSADLNKIFAAPLAAKNLMDILGIRNDVEVSVVREWSAALMAGIANVTNDPQIWGIVDRARSEMDSYLAQLISFYHRHPDKSYTSALVEAGLDDEAVSANVKLAISGGINEPQHAATSMVWGLNENPDQRAAVLADPSLWGNVFDEALRWVSPIGWIPAQALCDTNIAGVDVPKGSVIHSLVSSGNHDETVFCNPGDFDVRRKKVMHLAFGGGIHMCAGMWAAKWSIGNIAIPMLYERFEGLRNADDRESHWSGFVLRGLSSHAVTWDKDLKG